MDQQGQNGLLRTFHGTLGTRGPAAYLLAALLIGFYCLLYFTPSLDGIAQSVGLMSRWHLYGALYSLAMIAGAIRYLRLHGNSRYNRLRIATNVAVQVVLAFALPLVMAMLERPAFYASYLWPLDIYKLYPGTLRQLPLYLAIYVVLGSLLVAPLLAIFLGKRWYCSWVCGCGGLANTFGDPFRHLTASTERSHRVEKRTVHTVMVLAFVTTGLVLLSGFWPAAPAVLHRIVNGTGDALPVVGTLSLKGLYSFVIGALLSGVLGTGLYPLLGPRVWCRNFCPMAALLGLTQKLGSFRVRVKKGMCIACGNCTTYCEMGIDVRAYAMRDESFTRASCVGCGACAHVCPRGVLRLEQSAPRRRLPLVS